MDDSWCVGFQDVPLNKTTDDSPTSRGKRLFFQKKAAEREVSKMTVKSPTLGQTCFDESCVWRLKQFEITKKTNNTLFSTYQTAKGKNASQRSKIKGLLKFDDIVGRH